MKRRLSPVFRLSLGLAALTIMVLLGAKLVGVMPDHTKSALDARQKICEALALQLSWAALNNDYRSINETIETFVGNNADILSASLQSRRNGTVAEIGNHDANWAPPADGRSTPTNVQVPIYSDRGQWGSLQLAFTPLQSPNAVSTWVQSMPGLITFVGILVFFLFAMFLKRALKQLDPSRVIPAHVRAAFDTLAEGVIIMDEDEHIVMANQAFARLVGCDTAELTGRNAADLGWSSPASTHKRVECELPWQTALNSGITRTGIPLRLKTPVGGDNTLIVNGAPIVDGDGNPRGALATFDDVSELQKNNLQLQNTLKDLANSKEEINRQNKKLQFLASRDPLTQCLNRRALLESFEVLFETARVEQLPLCYAMIDIDHFKSFNDHYGHAAGDKVLKFVAKQLNSESRDEDIVARYGGEEFCVVMPDIDIDGAAKIGDRLRTAIKEGFSESFAASRDLTISVGIADLRDYTDTMDSLIQRADTALYAAKDLGRDRVVPWTESMGQPSTVESDDNHSDEPDHDKSMLIQVVSEPTVQLHLETLNSRVIELDAIIEGKSSEIHKNQGFDPLTGLPKRILFYDRVTQSLPSAQRDGNSVAILYMDIDLQQRVNDALEPVTGDPLLKIASERLTKALENAKELESLLKPDEGHTVARLGNNEFGIVLPDLVDTEAATWVVQYLIECMDKPIEHENSEVYANCSIGISLYPGDAEDVETLVSRASQARHLAHGNKGRHKYLFYSEDMNERSYEQIKLESQLRRALEKDEFVLHYQPTFSLNSGQIKGFEALLRWNHPDLGIVGPALFMHIAEQTGLIVPIGDWVLRKACQQARYWVDGGMTDMKMAVNLSTVQLRFDGLEQKVLSVLAETGLEPKHLELEVTETAMMDNVVKARRILHRLHDEGIAIAMDDFGTGYSSLSHLKHLAVDKIKIDQSFIRDVIDDHRDAAVVSSIIAMAKLMNLEVTAEGVENQEQLAFLRKRRCDMAQGFLLGRPIPVEEVEELLLEHQDTGATTALEKLPSIRAMHQDDGEATEQDEAVSLN